MAVSSSLSTPRHHRSREISIHSPSIHEASSTDLTRQITKVVEDRRMCIRGFVNVNVWGNRIVLLFMVLLCSFCRWSGSVHVLQHSTSRSTVSNAVLCLVILLLYLHQHNCRRNSLVVHSISSSSSSSSSSSVHHQLLETFVAFVCCSSGNQYPNASLSLSRTARGTCLVNTSASFSSPATSYKEPSLSQGGPQKAPKRPPRGTQASWAQPPASRHPNTQTPNTQAHQLPSSQARRFPRPPKHLGPQTNKLSVLSFGNAELGEILRVLSCSLLLSHMLGMFPSSFPPPACSTF